MDIKESNCFGVKLYKSFREWACGKDTEIY